MLPIFEETTSALYYSNDGRLRMERVLENDQRVYLLRLDGAEVMRTHERALSDAYIAGYDACLTTTEPRARLEQLRAALRAETISWGELAELQDLANYIAPDDVELREAAGLPEHE